MKKTCVECNRAIDANARICPYCNMDQVMSESERKRHAERQAAAVVQPALPPPEIPLTEKATARLASKIEERPMMSRALVIGAVAVFLMAVFAIGGLVYGLGRRESPIEKRIQSGEAIAQPTSDFPDLTLVTEADPTTTIGRSITTSPIPDPDHKTPPEFQRTDATALPAEAYSRILSQSSTQPTTSDYQVVDPRTITVPAVPPPRPKPKPVPVEERTEVANTTRPQPISQPVPSFNVDGTARFVLTIDTEGRVKEVRVLETIPGQTGKIISAIQRWRFKPATRDGVPVEGEFPVDISFVKRD